MGSVEKITVLLGHKGTSGDGLSAYCGLPGPIAIGGAMKWPPTLDAYNGESDFINIADKSIQRVNLPAKGGKVQAISIAPDSPIESVDIFLGDGGISEANRHRISVGCPYTGEIDADAIYVAMNRSIPAIGVFGGIAAWDTTESGTYAGERELPVRLNLYRGDARPIGHLKRAPYHAHFMFAELNVDTECYFYVIVDGRRRFSVHAFDCDGDDVELEIKAIESYKMRTSQPDPYRDYEMSRTLLASTPIATVEGSFYEFAYSGNPYFAIQVRAMGSSLAANGRGQVIVNAWDD